MQGELMTLQGELTVNPGVSADQLRGTRWVIHPGQYQRSIVAFDLTAPWLRVATRLRPTRIQVHGAAALALDYAVTSDLEAIAQRFGGRHLFYGWIELHGSLSKRYTIRAATVRVRYGHQGPNGTVWDS